MCYLYWIYDKNCNDVKEDGYVGVTQNLNKRFNKHKRVNDNIPNSNSLDIKVLFEGTRKECFKKEFEFRPELNIGWNNAVGGAQGFRTGFTHSKETKEKMRKLWTTEERRKKVPKKRPKHSKRMSGRKRPEHSKKMSGEGNPMYGKTHSKEARKKIIEANLGRTPWSKGKTYKLDTKECPHCGLVGGKQNMTRYHFDNCKKRKNIL